VNTRETILAAALRILEEGGSEHFSTRAVCARAGVTAPTLYHQFGSADGLLSAAMVAVLEEFLASKRAAVRSADPETALREGWDDYVRFASARPRLFAATFARLLGGARIAAAEEGQAELRRLVQAVQDEGRLALSVEAAVDLVWASASAAALLSVMALLRDAPPPEAEAIVALREAAMAALLATGGSP
jgi:AcrR family transcriptional regulator